MNKPITITGTVITVYMLATCFITNFNIGNLIVLFTGILIIIWGAFGSQLPNNKWMIALKTVIILCYTILLCIIAFIVSNAFNSGDQYNEDAVIVLGCAVNGNKPSNSLKLRINKCIDYYEKNPDVIIVVSGGQGPQENISEAEAMSIYLKLAGIPANQILLENQATSTNENFAYSKAILDKTFPLGYSVAYITNDFHIYRAGQLARLNGIYAAGYSARTDIASIVPSYVREALAVVQLWLFNK